MTGPRRGPGCAVAIATRDRGDKITPLLVSLQASTFTDFEAVIVDQSTNDLTEAAVAPFLTDDRIRYVRSDQRGLSRARNLAIAMTSAPIIAVTDDDCILSSDWLESMLLSFQADDRVAVVFCNVEPVPVEETGYTPHIRFDEARTLTSARQAWRHARSGLCLGAGMAVRRDAFEELSGFDNELGAGARFGSTEDNDLAWRALIAGWKVRHDPAPVVLHDGFRNLDEIRDLVVRDFFGVGGGISKHVRTRQPGALPFLLSWLWRFGIVEPVQQVLSGRRPNGFRRPMELIKGFTAGLRSPFDPATLKFVDPDR